MSWAPILNGCTVYDDAARPSDGRSGAVVIASCDDPGTPVLFDGAPVALDGALDLNLALVHDLGTGAKQAIWTPLDCDELAACMASSQPLGSADPHVHACVPGAFEARGPGNDYFWTGALP